MLLLKTLPYALFAGQIAHGRRARSAAASSSANVAAMFHLRPRPRRHPPALAAADCVAVYGPVLRYDYVYDNFLNNLLL